MMIIQTHYVNGQKCPYCQEDSILVHSSEIYGKGKNYGMMWACFPCGAWVGCHGDTDRALGRLADRTLREAKKAAHAWFDPLWKKTTRSRNKAYKWLAETLGISGRVCHIGYMDVEQCREVVRVCAEVWVKVGWIKEQQKPKL